MNEKHNIFLLDYSKLSHINNLLFDKNGRKYYYKVELDNPDYIALLPLRSKLIHPFGLRTIGVKGVDCSVAIVIKVTEENQFLKAPAFVSSTEYKKITNNETRIKNKFNDCVHALAKSLAKQELNLELNPTELNLLNFTTLTQFSYELGLSILKNHYIVSLKNKQI